MSKMDVIRLFALISMLYPKDKDFKNAEEPMVNAWHAMLKDMTFDQAQAAVQAHAALSPYSPAIADIRKRRQRLQTSQLDGDQAWAYARKAVSKYGYYQWQEAQEHTPPEVWQFVTEHFGFRNLCNAENTDVVRAQFLKLWELRLKREAENRLLPESVRMLTSGMGRLPEGVQ